MTARSKKASRIVVDLDTQTMKAYEGGNLVFAFDCVTGDKLHQTDAGVFHVLWKDEKHVSQKYGVPMHYALFFTRDGKALHQYHGLVPLWIIRRLKEDVTDHLGSHGCVRLQEDDAKALFYWAQNGTAVHVQGRLT